MNSTRISAIHYASKQPVAISISGGTIGEIMPLSSGGDDLPIVAPGLVDLQINGFLGHDFNTLPIADGMIGEVIRLLWREGVTSCFPTVITNIEDAITSAMTAMGRACDKDEATRSGIAGIHLEGPFISPEDGACGAHKREFVKAPDWDLLTRWQEASGGRIRILTMSPEWPGSAGFIGRCVKNNITVSIGHTSATPQQIAEAVRAGARMSTHLGNGTHLMLPRHPNYLWEQLAQDELWTCMIADGFHLPDQVIKVIMKVKGEQAMLVSDAVALAGMPAGNYATPVGGDVVLTAQGKAHLAGNEKILAGSAQILLRHIEHLIEAKLADFSQAWEMSSIRPSRFMALKSAKGLSVGAPADLVLLKHEQGLVRLLATYKAGQRVWANDATFSA